MPSGLYYNYQLRRIPACIYDVTKIHTCHPNEEQQLAETVARNTSLQRWISELGVLSRPFSLLQNKII